MPVSLGVSKMPDSNGTGFVGHRSPLLIVLFLLSALILLETLSLSYDTKTGREYNAETVPFMNMVATAVLTNPGILFKISNNCNLLNSHTIERRLETAV
jgi:hypothetical protein